MDCIVFAPEAAARSLPEPCRHIVIPDRLPSALWRRAMLRGELRRELIDVLWSPTTALPPRSDSDKTRRVATVHELPALHSEADVPPLRALRDERARADLASRADLVVVPSERSAADLGREHKELDSRIRVVPQPLGEAYLKCATGAVTPNGASRAATTARCDAHARQRDAHARQRDAHARQRDAHARPASAQVRPRGALYIGADRRRKNLTRLMRAHEDLAPALRAEHRLRWIGGPQREGWQVLPRLDDEGVRDYLRSVRGVTLPSLSEGFGLPAVEALAAGRPVLGARDSVTTDLCGDLCVAVDPYDITSIRRGLERLFCDDELLERAETKGPARVRDLSAAKVAEHWSRLIEEVTR